MERIPRGIYTQEFRSQALRLHEVDGLTILKLQDGCHYWEGR